MITIKRSTSRVSGGGGTGSQRTTNSQQPTKTMTKCGKCCYYFRQVITFLFSHIGLGTLLLGYALMGAFTFQALESDHEEQQREEMRLTRNKMIQELSEMTNRSSILKYENWTSMAEGILRKFEMKFLDAVKHRGYDGNEELAKTTSQWSFSGALLYSIIVITTIGYGNVAPRTHWGKIVTILYAIIGIPLMLFCLSNIGHTMAHSFKFIYWKCCCYLCVKPKKAQRKRRRRIRRKIRKHRRNQRNAAMKLRMQPIGGNHHPNLNNLKRSCVNSNLAIAQSNSFMDLEQPQTRNLSQSPSQRSTIINQHQMMDDNNNVQFTYGTDSASSAFTSVNATPIRRSFAMDPIAIISPQQIQNNSTANNNQLQIPSIQKKQPILARSLSARYHNELSKNRKKLQQQQQTIANYDKQQLQLQQNKLQKSSSSMMKNNHQNQQQILMKPFRKTTMNVEQVIRNKYASNSDEYIDIVYQFDPEETQRQLKYAQQQQQQQLQQQSTVRFHPTKSYSSLVVPELQRQSSPIPGIYTSGSLNTHNLNPHLNQYRRSISVIEPPPHPLPMLNVQQSQQQLQPPSFEMMHLNNHRQFGNYTNCGESGYTFPIENNNEPINDISDLSESSDSDSSEDSDIQEKNIPITVCLALVISYICGGAWFFSASEEWTFLDASYFCFITLSTIGFGDLVPGRTVLSTHLDDGQMTLAICALYLLFGMALLAMSLNLVKEKVLETVRIIGERIGILVNDEDDENY